MNEFQFHFLRPEWLLALLPLAYILLKLVRHDSGQNDWQQVVDPHLLDELLTPASKESSRTPGIILAIAWFLTVIALSGPTWEKAPPLKYRPDVPPLVMVLDLSRSMQVRDVHPTRLAVAKARLRTLLKQLPPRPLGLVVYAEQAHTAMPLTRDKKLITQVLGEVTTTLMPAQGSNAAGGLKLAAELLSRTNYKHGDILLLSDAADQETINMADSIRDSGFQTSVMALGTLAGGEVPDDENAGYLIANGIPVSSAVNEPVLRGVAEAGGGSFVRITNNSGKIDVIKDNLGTAGTGTAEKTAKLGQVWRERGPWIAMLVLPLALLAFRRGALVAILICLVLPIPDAQALSWDSLWLNRDQLGHKAIQQKDILEAREQFQDTMWRGVAAYRDHDFKTALRHFSRLNSADAHYNRGNALMQLGRAEEAMQAYRQALKKDSGHADAKFNLELVERRTREAREKENPQPDAELAKETQEQQSNQGKQTETAEDVVETPKAEELTMQMGKADKDLDKIGTLGGGAMLLPGSQESEGEQDSRIGQGLDDGSEWDDEINRLARESRQQGGEQRESEGSSKLEQNKFVFPPPQTETEQRESPEQSEQKPAGDSSQTMTDASSESGQKEKEQGEQDTGDREQQTVLPPTGVAGATPAGGSARESQQATEQWLSRIPVGQADLLKEKFQREYQRRGITRTGGDPW